MKPERILLPLDIRKCPLEVFSAVNGFAQHPEATVILLHVVTLDITMPEKRVYEEHAVDARWYLDRLARGCLRPGLACAIRVRAGRPAEEILAEAAASRADLIVLPSYPPTFWNRLLGPILPRVVRQVVRRAPCGVVLANVQDRFNCEDTWGRSAGRRDATPGHWDRARERQHSHGSLKEAAMVSRHEPQHAAA